LALSPAQASVALFELNQKYGMPPSQKRAPPNKNRLLAQKESDNKKKPMPRCLTRLNKWHTYAH